MMPACIFGEADALLEGEMRRNPKTASTPAPRPRCGCPGTPSPSPLLKTHLTCPSCGSTHVAQMLGDNGGVSYVCTACGHSWS
jgi:DNA-directed RNA polymerase subunit M/transcription elongation factor TFIIS